MTTGTRLAVLPLIAVLLASVFAPAAVADRHAEVFDLTPSSYRFTSGDELSLGAVLDVGRAGQLATVEFQTGFSSWRAVARAPVGADGEVSVPVDSLVGISTYRLEVGPRWSRATSRPVTVEGALRLVRTASHVVVSGQLPTPVRRPVTIQGWSGEAGGPAFPTETDETGRVEFSRSLEPMPQGFGLVAPAYTDEHQQSWPEFISDDAPTALPVRRHLPVAVTSRPYAASLRPPGSHDAGLGEFRVDSGALPDGLQLAPDTGLLSGVPTRSGIFTFSVAADDRSFSTTIVVERPGPAPVGRVRDLGWNSYEQAQSGSGRQVLFDAESTFLAGPGTIGRQVYLEDTDTGVRRPIVRAAGADPETHGFALAADLSASGRFALFTTGSSLIPGDASGGLYLCTLATSALTRVSAGTPEERTITGGGSVSADGEVVAFLRQRTAYPEGQEKVDVFVWTRTGGVRRISTTPSGQNAVTPLGTLQVSDDGRYVAFAQQGVAQGATVVRIALWDRTTGRTTLLPVAETAAASMKLVSLSADAAEILVQGERDEYLWSRSTGRYSAVPKPPPLVAGAAYRRDATISGSGRFLLITSREDSHQSVWRYDRTSKALLRLPEVDPADSAWGAEIEGAALSDDGQVALLKQPAGRLLQWRLS